MRQRGHYSTFSRIDQTPFPDVTVKVQDVEYVGSYGYPQKLPRVQRPEVVFFGRSNVGKSSLINTLLGRRGIARISKTPGKTRSANFFKINDRFFLVDMPGYGYARVPKAEKQRWVQILDQYLTDTTRHNSLVQLIDIRHDPTDTDVENAARLTRSGRPVCVVFNKVDKVKKGQLDKRIRDALARLHLDPKTALVPFSSVSGVGKRQLWTWIEETLSI